MIRKPVAIIVGLILLLGGLFKCDAFSQESVIPDPPLLPDEYTTGPYHFNQVHDDLSDKPKDDYKDSMFIEVGKCSMIAP